MEVWDNFVRIVDSEFKYLERDFGFYQTSTEIPFIKYESERIPIRIQIWLNFRGGNELDLGIYRLPQINEQIDNSIGIDALVGLYGEQRKYIYPDYTKDGLEQAVQELAEMLLKYGAPVLKGDLSDLKKIENIGKERIKRFRR